MTVRVTSLRATSVFIEPSVDPGGGGGGGGTGGTGYVGGSDQPGANAAIAGMFGGEGTTKSTHGNASQSWINHPMPDDAARDTVNEASAIRDLLQNTYEIATGTDPADTSIYPTGGGPSWGPLVAYPYINFTAYTSAINIIDHTTTPYKRVECIDASRRTASWHMGVNAMMWAGIPLPDGMQPTNDSDGTIHVYDPNWKWVGDPTNQNYWGAIWELWGAKSPEMHAAAGDSYTTWTAKSAGRMTGVNKRLTARMTNRTSGDAASHARDTMGAPAAPWDPILTTQPGYIYWGYGPDGLAEQTTWLASASHLPMSHHIWTRRDFLNGVINHPLGFMLFPMYPSSQGGKGMVWPSTGYDGASRSYLKHGHRLRFPAGSTPNYPSAMPTSWRPIFDQWFYCIRDFGTMLVDTTGNSIGWRAEPGVEKLLPTGFGSKTFLEYLFQDVHAGTRSMQLIAPGSDTAFYP
jgi:hypothetical protein